MKTTVLVIDDSLSLCDHALMVLDRAGFNTITAPDAETGLAMIERYHPEVIVLDVVLPGMSGLAMLRIIRERKIPVSVLLLTVKSSVCERVRGLNAGADDYISKPFSDEELVARINAAVRRRSIEKTLTALVDARTRELVEKERQAVIGRMVQGFIHNLNGPMTAICGWGELAAMKVEQMANTLDSGDTLSRELCEGIRHDLTTMIAGIDKAQELINCILTKSRQEACDHQKKINLPDLLRHEIDFMKSDLTFKRNVKIIFSIDPSIPELYGQYSDFSQLVYNLVQNASDAMVDSEVKELKISIHQDNDNIFMEFEDSGCGIAGENLGRVFDPFFTTKNIGESGSRNHASVGLGLYSCRQLMKPYGADITVACNPGGCGTVFTVVIPKTGNVV